MRPATYPLHLMLNTAQLMMREECTPSNHAIRNSSSTKEEPCKA